MTSERVGGAASRLGAAEKSSPTAATIVGSKRVLRPAAQTGESIAQAAERPHRPGQAPTRGRFVGQRQLMRSFGLVGRRLAGLADPLFALFEQLAQVAVLVHETVDLQPG